jgi:iron complex transport system permease protein
LTSLAARQISVVVAALVAVAAGTVASMALGAVHVPVHDVTDALSGAMADGPLKTIVLQLRLPRTVDAIAVGAALGIAGALLQGALGNPLASPDVIGVTGGSAFGAMLVLLAFPSAIALLPIGALVFGLVAAALVFGIAWSSANGGSIARLILAGIAITALFGAGTMTLMTAYPDRVQGAIFWMAGGLTSEGWDATRAVAPYLAVGLIGAALLIRPLDRLALGDDVAASLGARPRLIRLGAGVAAALLAASAAALAGLLTFVGLVVPHVVRMAGGTARHGFVVPASGLVGAALVLAGDTLARTVMAPRELPVGPFMVLLGVPVFLWLLRKAT